MVTVIANQKGGVGKTTTSLALAENLYSIGKKVLLIDLDPQGNLTTALLASNQQGIYDLIDGADFSQLVQKTRVGDFLASTNRLSLAEKEYADTGREFYLKEALAPILDNYDHIIIDTPPNLGILLVNALTAADYVIVPVITDLFSVSGLAQIFTSIGNVQKYTNTNLKMAGIVITRYNSRMVLNRELKQSLDEETAQLNVPIFKTMIREGVAVRETQATREELGSASNPGKDYQNFTKEFLEVTENG